MNQTLSKPKHDAKARASPAPIREATDQVVITTEAGSVPNITATLSRGNVINRNGRYYPAVELEKAANAAHDRLASGQVIGLMDHPGWEDGNKGKPERTVIKWSRLWMEGPDLMGEGTILNTALGRDLLALREGGVHIALSTNAMARMTFEAAKHVPASYDGDEDDLIAVMTDIELLTIDVVNDPSNVFAAIHAEAVAAREGYTAEQENKMTIEEMKKELEAARAAQEAAEAALATAQEEATAAQEAAKAAERNHVVDVALAARPGLPDAIVEAMRLAARSAESVDAAKIAVTKLADSIPATGNGNNGVPAGDPKPASERFDPMRAYRNQH